MAEIAPGVFVSTASAGEWEPDTDPPGEVRMRAGSTLQRVTLEKLSGNTWCRVPASFFHVRCGENYAKCVFLKLRDC